MIKVAVVEDNDDIRNALKALIGGSHGYECNHIYSSAEEAISFLPGQEIDVVLMDIHMDGMDGIACVQKLRSIMAGVQFMMCTVYDDDDNIFSALEAGATGYILKRTSPAQILEAISELHQGGSPMSSEIARRVVAFFSRKNKSGDLLTAREKEILDYMAKGFLYKEIADTLFISKETVKKHIHNIYEKLQVNTRVKALNKTSYLR